MRFSLRMVALCGAIKQSYFSGLAAYFGLFGMERNPA